jgi:putative transposase
MEWFNRSMRRPAVNECGHAHELTFSCFHRYAFLKAERTCQWLADAIDEARKRLDFAVWAYVFMPEHVHIIVYPRRAQ